MTNSLDPDQAQQRIVRPDLGPNCLSRLSATTLVDKELKLLPELFLINGQMVNHFLCKSRKFNAKFDSSKNFSTISLPDSILIVLFSAVETDKNIKVRILINLREKIYNPEGNII